MEQIRLSGYISEHQSYLNGARYYLIEGSGTENTDLTFAIWFTLPKEEGAPIIEGDLSVSRADVELWLADVESGAHDETLDEALDAPVLEIALRLRRRTDDCAWTQQLGRADIRIAGDAAQITLSWLDAG